MKIFKDRKAERRFFELYDTLPLEKQKIIGQMIRDLAGMKMEGDGNEFYVTEEDVLTTWDAISRNPSC